MNSKEYKLLKKTPETCSLLSCLFLRYVQVCTQLQNLRKIGEMAKFADQEQEKNHQTTDFSQFSQIL